jgi:hypothetical protein
LRGVSLKEIRFRQIALVTVLLALPTLTFSQTSSQAGSGSTPQTTSASQTAAVADAHAVPVLDGGIGPCSADFIINDESGAPVYAAKVSVHIAYGFFSIRKLDLQLSTNIDGKARFTGLPNKIKHGIYFHASEGDRAGEAFDDPANTCKAQFTIVLQKKQ